jgi:hypothetical protein
MGMGRLQQAVDYYRSSPGYPYFNIVSGDFNGDGHPDVAVGVDTVFSVFLNSAGTTRQSTTTTVEVVNNGCGSVTVNATVTSGGQKPTGTLTLQVDGQYYAAAQFPSLNSSGQASVNITLSIVAHTITVIYSGDSHTQGSSSSQSVKIGPLPSSTSLTSNPNPSGLSQLVGFTATVTATGTSTNCLSGSVTFFDGTTSLGTVGLTIISSQSASVLFTTSALALGSHSITARYGGSTYFTASTSPVLVQVVETPATAVLTPASLSFPKTLVGQTSAGQTATLANTGQLALTISSIFTSGNFNETNNCGTSLAGGQSCTITVTFAPTQNGMLTGQLSVNDSAGTQTVNLSGTGFGGTSPSPSISLSPSSLTFPSQYVGTSGLPQTVTLTNNGTFTVAISSVAASSSFSAVNGCSSSVAPGVSCSIGVFFDPMQAGTIDGRLTVTDNASGSPQTVSLTGMGQGFSMASSGSSTATVSAGQTANYSISISPAGGFKQTVALSCTGAPTGARCSVPASVTLNGSSPTMVNVTVTTSASMANLRHPNRYSLTGSRLAVWLAFPGLVGLVLLSSGGKHRGKQVGRTLGGFAFLCLISMAIGLASCGGSNGNNGTGSNGTPYDLTVTGTFASGSTTVTNSTKLILVIQ